MSTRHIAAVMLLAAACDTSVPLDRADTARETSTMSVADTSVAPAPDAVAEVVEAAPPGIDFGEGVGDRVEPQTVVHLSFTADADPTDPIVGYLWNVTQPAGSVSTFRPSATVASPQLEVDVAGTYELDVALTHQSGNVSHLYRLLSAVPDSTIHFELLWHTPGDPDETDAGMIGNGSSVGSDMDLHFVRLPDATTAPSDAAFFDGTADCTWLFPAPRWDTGDGVERPTLDRDDTDGAGPENLNLDPLGGHCYAVAVHYWSDWDYGWSTATVRYFREGVLVFETAADTVNGDMWIVGKVCADDLELTPEADCADATCPPTIIPNFQVPQARGGVPVFPLNP